MGKQRERERDSSSYGSSSNEAIKGRSECKRMGQTLCEPVKEVLEAERESCLFLFR